MSALSYFEAIESKVKSLLCQGLTTSAQLADNFAEVFPPAVLPQRLAEIGAGFVCNKAPSDYSYPGDSTPPFTGGQCVGVLYDVSWTGSLASSSSPQFNITQTGVSSGKAGPIKEIKWIYGYQTSTTWSLVLFYGQSQETNLLTVSDPSQVYNSQTAQITGIVREDGNPDDCGNPDPSPPLPAAPVSFLNEPVDFTDDSGNPKTENKDFVFYPPYIDISDNLSLDVKIDNLIGKLDLLPDLVFRPNIGNPTPDNSDPIGDTNIEEDPEEELEEETKQKIIGVRIYAKKLSSARVTEILTEGFPTLLIPRVANVSFRFDFKAGKNWSPVIEATNLRCYIPVPGALPAQDVQVDFATGFTGYYQKVFEPDKEER